MTELNLLAKNSNLRFDGSQSAASIAMPKGSSGRIMEWSSDNSECLCEITSKDDSSDFWRIWVKRVVIGQYFAAK